MAPIHVSNTNKGEAVATAHEVLEKVDMIEKIDEFPAQLSGRYNNGSPSAVPWP